MKSDAPILPHGGRRVKSLPLFSPVSPNRDSLALHQQREQRRRTDASPLIAS
jgi:hypothetical protein